MERFVRLLLAGGVTVVGGLWAVALTAAGTPAWLGGVGAAVLGSAALLAGILIEVDI